MRRTLLTQLPPPDLRWPRLDANIPLAAGYLAAWCKREVPAAELGVLPWLEADTFGDVALVDTLLARKPDLVGLSVYLWNAERSLHLARQLQDAGVSVVLGGPEVTPGNAWLWSATGFAHRICGEGEEQFAALLAERPAGRSPLDLTQLPSPYLEGVLSPSPDGALWLETVRGCPFRCRYCNYGRRHHRPRAFPPDWLQRHLRWARVNGAGELYLMDPSFNVRTDWERVLSDLEEANPDRELSLHTELVADALRPGDARRLAAAGLVSCELGLQSSQPQVLAAVNRPWHKEAWLRGARELLDAGVDATVGLILGLPEDTPERFAATVEFVLGELPGADLQVFPLALLPDTELRQEADALGLEHQSRPPYTVTRTPGYTPEDFTAALEWFEQRTGLELDPIPLPNLAGDWGGGEAAAYISGAYLDADSGALPPDWPERLIPRAARHLTLWVAGWQPGLPRQLGRLMAALPFGMVTLVLDAGAGWPVDRLGQLLTTGTGDHYLDRCGSNLYGPGARLVPRLAVLVPLGDPGASPEWQAAVRSQADWIWAVEMEDSRRQQTQQLLGEGENLLVRGRPAQFDLRKLATAVGSDARGLMFDDAALQSHWFELTGDAQFRVPEHRIRIP